jgi:hypothetical protein
MVLSLEGKDLRNQIKKYNVKMAKKELKYKLKDEKWKIDEAQYDKLEEQKQLESEDKLKKLQKLQNQNNQDIMFMQECGMDEYSNYDFYDLNYSISKKKFLKKKYFFRNKIKPTGDISVEAVNATSMLINTKFIKNITIISN